jgi:hypothetical protein
MRPQRILDQGRIVEPRGLGEDRTSHLARFVERQRAYDLGRRIGTGGQPDGQQGARGKLNIHRQTVEDVVEDSDLVFRVLIRPDDEQVGHVTQQRPPTFSRGGRDRVVDVPQDREAGGHQRTPRCGQLWPPATALTPQPNISRHRPNAAGATPIDRILPVP